jgi:hypothetical protein
LELLSKKLEEKRPVLNQGILDALEASNEKIIPSPKLVKSPGRKPGARNKRSEALHEVLDQMGAHPEIFLANVMLNNQKELTFFPTVDQRILAAKLLMTYRWPKPITQIQSESVTHQVNWTFEPSLGEVPST